VFGSGPSAALDLPGSLRRMIFHLSTVVGIPIPCAIESWNVSRIDVTGNLLLPSLASVRQALSILRNVEGGRYRVSS